MTDLETLERALRNADAAGDSDAAHTFAGEIQKLRGTQTRAPSKGFLDEHPNVKTALQIGLPAAGAVVGGLAAAPFTGGLSTLPAMGLLLAGEGVGSLLGESVNQATGVSPVDPRQMGMATVAPMLGRTIGGAIANIPKFLPGFGEAARAAVVPEMREMPGKMFPGDATAAYKALGNATQNQNPHILGFPRLGAAVKELDKQVDEVPWDQLQSRLRLTGQSDLFEQITNTLKGAAPKTTQVAPTIGGKALNAGLPKQTVTTSPGRAPGLNFGEARAASEGLNKIIMSTTDPKERGVYQKLRGALLDDIENAPMPANGNPNVIGLWKEARAAAKNENARAKLTEVTERAIRTKDGVDIVDPNQIVKWLRTSDEIKSRVSSSEYRDILNTYRGMSSVVGHNLGKFWGMILGSAAGTATGAVFGGGAGAVGGGTAGYIASEGLARAMMTDTGRKWVRIMMNNPTESNFRKGMAVIGAASGAAIPRGEGEE